LFTVSELRVRILEPPAGAVISSGTLWVRGTVDGGPDVAVSVAVPPPLRQVIGLDAVPAPHAAGTFAVELPVVPGMALVTVLARDGSGAQASDAVAISVVEPLSAVVRFDPSPSAGLAPLTVRIPDSVVAAGRAYSVDLESDGIPDDHGDGLPQRAFVYTKPGIHVATLQAIAPSGVPLVARGSIEVYDRVVLEARLRAVWAGFKAALGSGDAASAASFVHAHRRAAWLAYFDSLTPAQLAAANTIFTDLTLLDVAPGRAECEMMRDVDGLLYSFPVSFGIDVDGGWKLWQF
jgi:hypothetical protein